MTTTEPEKFMCRHLLRHFAKHDRKTMRSRLYIFIVQEMWNINLLAINFFHIILEKIHEYIENYAIRNNVPLRPRPLPPYIDHIENLLQKEEGDAFKITIKRPFSVAGVEFGLLSPFRFFSGYLFSYIISLGLRLIEKFTFFTFFLYFCIFCVFFFHFFFQLYLHSHSQEKIINEEQYIGEWMRLYALHNQVQKSRQIQKTKLEKFLDLKYTKFILGFSSVFLLKVIGI